MSAPRINGIVESCLYADDLRPSIRFYRDRLGLHLLQSDDRFAVFRVSEHQVLLIFRSGSRQEPVPTPGGLIPPHDAAGQLHFAFSISKENFAAWEKHLTAEGIPIESKVTWPEGGQSIYFRDPANHLVELATPGIWPGIQ
jgi:catechol 2,3-dioxygenase-like lactoylglutathione lyase family enzyme